IGADQPEDLPGRDGQVQRVDGGEFVEAFGQVACLDDRGHCLKGGYWFSRISASTGMLDFSSRFGFSTSILMRYTSFTRSCCGGMRVGVNSACDGMKLIRPLYVFFDESDVTFTFDPSLTLLRSVSLM